jgi:hypothetical protein
MSVEFESPIDLNQLELQNVQLQQLGSDPSAPVEGQVFWRSDAHRPRVYTGATGAYLIKDGDDKMAFNLTPTDTVITEGVLGWNATDHTLNIGMEDGVVQQVGQEFFVRAHNETGSTIPNGRAVRLTTSASPDGQIHIALADKSTAGGDVVIAITTMEIPNGEYGLCTKYGCVRGLDTSMLTEGDKVYLASNGLYSATPGAWPDYKILLGYCVVSSATVGVIYVSVDNSSTLEALHDVDVIASPTAGSSLVFENGRWTGKNFADTSKEVTGFTDPSNIVVTYNSAARTVTLTGSVLAYFNNLTVASLVSGWTSPAHLTGRTATQYLYYDGTNFVWGDGVPWQFYQLQIAAVVINPAGTVICAVRECHSTLQWQAHKAFHQTVGCYLNAGGDMPSASYAVNSYTPANRRPLVDATYLADEDLPSTLPALLTESYTRFSLTGASTMVLATAQTDIVSVTGATPNWNSFVGGVWTQVPMIKDQYAAVFLMAMPVTADAGSQAYRYVWIQPQAVSTTLATIQGLSPSQINLDGLAGLNPELCFIGKIIIRYDGPANNDWLLYSVEKLTGTKVSQTQVVGNFLSAVSVDGTTITGNGTSTSPIAVGAIAESQVTNLVTDLAGKQDSGVCLPLAGGTLTGTAISSITPPLNSSVSNLQMQSGATVSGKFQTLNSGGIIHGSFLLGNGTNTNAMSIATDSDKITFTGALGASNLSGTNTGDETTATIKTKLGITTLSGSNTGDQTLSSLGASPAFSITAGAIPKVNTGGATLVASNLSDSGTAITASVPIHVGSLKIQSYISDTTMGAIYAGATIPSGANYSIYFEKNGASTQVNGSNNSSLNVGDAPKILATATAITASVPILFGTGGAKISNWSGNNVVGIEGSYALVSRIMRTGYGAGFEFRVEDTNTAVLEVYDRTLNAYKALKVNTSSYDLQVSEVSKLGISSTVITASVPVQSTSTLQLGGGSATQLSLTATESTFDKPLAYQIITRTSTAAWAMPAGYSQYIYSLATSTSASWTLPTGVAKGQELIVKNVTGSSANINLLAPSGQSIQGLSTCANAYSIKCVFLLSNNTWYCSY